MYIINSISDFLNIPNSDSNHFVLNTDLDFSSIESFRTLEFNKKLKTIMFNGNNHVLRNLKNVDPKFCGLFDKIPFDSFIENLVIENFEIQSNHRNHTGLLCSENNGVIRNITVKNCTLSSDFGGLICGHNQGQILNCTVEDSKVTCNNIAGGISSASSLVTFLSKLTSNIKIQDCNVIRTKICSGQSAGGITGYVYNSAVCNCNVIGSTLICNTGDVGGIASKNNSLIRNCSVLLSDIVGLNPSVFVFSNSSTGSLVNCFGVVYVESSGENRFEPLLGENNGFFLQCHIFCFVKDSKNLKKFEPKKVCDYSFVLHRI